MTPSPYDSDTVFQALQDQWMERPEEGIYSSDNFAAIDTLDKTSKESLSIYDHVCEQENDDLSDDTSSVAGSIFTDSSEASSQSSYSSVTSDDPDDVSDRHDSLDSKLSGDNSLAKQHLRKHLDDQDATLAGLGAYDSIANTRQQEHLTGHKRHQPIPRSHPSIPRPKTNNRRRSGSHASANGPPSLKRDTDSSDCFVAFLITFAARLITAIWPLSGTPPMMSSCFNGAGVLPLATFIHETLRRSKTSYSTLQVALFYIILLKGKLSDRDFTKEQCKSGDSTQSGAPTCRAMQCGRRMFLASLMLASKYLQDRNYSTRAWSKISGLRMPEINENETEYLRCIDYRLHMRKEAFENWSKIVINLSKLSKARSCFASDIASLRKDAPEADSIQTPILESINILPDSDTFAIFSNRWWSELVNNIQPGLVDDGSMTDAFVQELAPLVETAELLARSGVGLPTPPTSPESLPEWSPSNVPAMTLSQNLPFRNGPTPSFPIPMDMRAPSPVRSGGLPLRPQPPNLPTPQSTPGGTDAWRIVTHRNQQQSLRCSASADALRSMHRLDFMTANLDRCPPPRPRPSALPPVRSLVAPAAPSPVCYSGVTTPSVFSPASSISSGPISRTSRSRASSISSNSSFSSWGSGPSREIQSHIRSQSSGVQAPGLPVPVEPQAKQILPGAGRSLRPTSVSNSNVICSPDEQIPTTEPPFVDEGLHSDEDRPVSEPVPATIQAAAEEHAAMALLAMGTANAHVPQSKVRCTSAQSMPESRGHKRTISKTEESLHECVKQYLHDQLRSDQLMQDAITPTPFCSYIKPSKQIQEPSKPWAERRMPVPNSRDRKRIAVSCRMHELSAAERASHILKREYLEHQMLPFMPLLPSVAFP